jgi:hypothetical protein
LTRAHSAEKRYGRRAAASNDAVFPPGLALLQAIANVVVSVDCLCQHLLKSLFPVQQATVAVRSSVGRV